MNSYSFQTLEEEVEMPKRQETLLLEAALKKKTKKQRIYGCEEITIGFQNSGNGHEIVDFMTLDSKSIIRCYEIKVTIADFKSAAKKSWYGNYNYLVVSSALYCSYKDYIQEHTPLHVGILVGEYLHSERNCQRIDIPSEQYQMLLESMVRSMYWKLSKYYDAANADLQRNANAEIRKLKKQLSEAEHRASDDEHLIREYELFKEHYEELDDYDFRRDVKTLRKKYLEEMRNK